MRLYGIIPPPLSPPLILSHPLPPPSQLAKEMDVVQETCVELEKEVAEVKGQLSDRDSRLFHLEKVLFFCVFVPYHWTPSTYTHPCLYCMLIINDTCTYIIMQRYQSATESLNDARQEADSLRVRLSNIQRTCSLYMIVHACVLY